MLKRRFSIVFVAFLLLSLGACQTSPSKESAEDSTPGSENSASNHAYFGEKINADGAITMLELSEKMGNTDSLAVKVKATVNEVCQAKGCWMNLNDLAEKSNSMKVTFKDYGFFVPKDISGKEVIVEGYAYREVTPVETLRHYAEDAGKSKEEIEAINTPVEELKFLASGVIVLQ